MYTGAWRGKNPGLPWGNLWAGLEAEVAKIPKVAAKNFLADEVAVVGFRLDGWHRLDSAVSIDREGPAALTPGKRESVT